MTRRPAVGTNAAANTTERTLSANRPSPRIAALAAVFVVVVGCHSARLVTACPPYLLVGVVGVAVHDATTGAPAAAGALLTAQVHLGSEIVSDTAPPTTDGLYLALGTQPGTYDLTLSKTGYVKWAKTVNVLTDRSGCHAEPVIITADLQPMP